MNTEVRITKKQKLVMILMGVTATLTQGAHIQGMMANNAAMAQPKYEIMRLYVAL